MRLLQVLAASAFVVACSGDSEDSSDTDLHPGEQDSFSDPNPDRCADIPASEAWEGVFFTNSDGSLRSVYVSRHASTCEDLVCSTIGGEDLSAEWRRIGMPSDVTEPVGLSVWPDYSSLTVTCGMCESSVSGNSSSEETDNQSGHVEILSAAPDRVEGCAVSLDSCEPFRFVATSCE